jgi:CRP-like cAMP-binding protein
MATDSAIVLEQNGGEGRTVKSDCQSCHVLAKSVFREMKDAFFERVRNGGTIQRIPVGKTIVTEGAPAEAAFCVESGVVKLTRTGDRGDVQVIRLLAPPQVCGLRPIIAGDDFAVTATALVDAMICCVPRELVLELLEKSPSFARATLRYLAYELRKSENILMVRSQRSVRRRVADILLLLNGHTIHGEVWDPLPRFQAKRKDIAEMVGVAPETLSRTLAEFARDGIIRLTRRRLDLVDVAALQDISC